MKPVHWLLLPYELPSKQNSERISLWRQREKIGCSGAEDFGLPEGCHRFDALYAILQK
jgi:hypothetical protein